ATDQCLDAFEPVACCRQFGGGALGIDREHRTRDQLGGQLLLPLVALGRIEPACSENAFELLDASLDQLPASANRVELRVGVLVFAHERLEPKPCARCEIAEIEGCHGFRLQASALSAIDDAYA